MCNRAAALANLGIPDRGLPQVPRITFLKKEGKRHIENYGSVLAMLGREFPRAELALLSDRQLAAMSVREQVGQSLLP